MKARNPRQRLVALEAPQHLAHITTHNANSPFLKLPGEIRNHIYEYVLGGKLIKIDNLRGPSQYHRKSIYTWTVKSYPQDANISDARNVQSYSRSQYGSWRNPVKPDKVFDKSYSLPYVCRQLYLETQTLIYRLNILQFESLWWAKTWSEDRSEGQLIAVEDVKIWGDGPNSKGKPENLYVVFPSLKRLR